MEWGQLINSRKQDSWTYGMLYDKEFSSQINAAVEINGNYSITFNQTMLFVNFRTKITLSERLKLLFSGEKSIVLPKGRESIYIAYIALQLTI